MIPCPNPFLLYAYIDGQGSSFSIRLMHFGTIKQQWTPSRMWVETMATHTKANAEGQGRAILTAITAHNPEGVYRSVEININMLITHLPQKQMYQSNKCAMHALTVYCTHWYSCNRLANI